MPTASAFCAVDSRSKILYLASVDGQLGSYDVEKFCFFDYTVLQQMPNKPLTSMILHKDKVGIVNSIIVRGLLSFVIFADIAG